MPRRIDVGSLTLPTLRLECAAGLDVLVAKGKARPTRFAPAKESQRVVRMLIG
jgi:hypothetical protein